MERLRTKASEKSEDNPTSISSSFKSIPFTHDQLGWLEDYPDCWMQILNTPKGIDYDAGQPKEKIQVRDLLDYVYKNNDQNIWRSWEISRDKDGKENIGRVPLWLDIDDESQNLTNSYNLSRICIDLLIENPGWAGDKDRIRVGFSGKKGFHIYVKPPIPLDGWTVKNELMVKAHARLENEEVGNFTMNTFFGTTVIDVAHEEIRVMGSLHSWQGENGEIIARRTFELSVQDFSSMSVNDILHHSD